MFNTWLITLPVIRRFDNLRRITNPTETEKYDDVYENETLFPFFRPSIDPLDLKTAMNLKDSVEAALNKLTDAQQFVIYLAYYEGLTEKRNLQPAKKFLVPTVKSKIKNSFKQP